MDTNETIRENGTFNLAYEMAAHMRSWAGPIPAAGEAKIRAAGRGGNDVVVGRSTAYYLNRLAVATPLVALDYAPLIAEPAQLIKLAHQQVPAPDAVGGGLDGNVSRTLGRRLMNFGIDSGDNGNGNNGGVTGEWADIIRMAATAAPLGLYSVNYHRTANDDGTPTENAAGWMKFAFQRGGYSMSADRDLILNPWHAWSLQDINRLKWMGFIDDFGLWKLLAGSGFPRGQDTHYAKALAQVLPSPGELLSWGGSGLFNNALAGRYGLDACDESAVFYAKAQGFGSAGEPIPNAPEGTANWTTIAARAAKRLPGLGECLEMQRRFRSLPANPAVAMDGHSPPWSEQNTREILQLQGFPDPLINNLVALANEPINVRIVNEVLIETLRHPAVAAMAAAVTAEGVDWVAEAYLSHGMAPEWAGIAAAAIRAKADDTYNEEKIANKRQLRAETRRVWLERYRLGNATTEDASMGMADEFFDAGMAATAIHNVESEIGMELIKGQLASLKKMYLAGGISGPQLDNQIQSLGVTAWRAGWYKQEWTWERLEGTRFASTGEILQYMKSGLLTPAAALVRLQNLGWSNADALLEVAQVQLGISDAKAKELAREAAKSAAEAQTLARERAAAAKQLQAETLAKAKEVSRLNLADSLAVHEQLLARDKYYAAVHLANDEYAKAAAKKDQEKMDALIQKELGDYQNYLIEQSRIFAGMSARGQHVSKIDTTEAPGPDTVKSADTGGAASGGKTGVPTGSGGKDGGTIGP